MNKLQANKAEYAKTYESAAILTPGPSREEEQYCFPFVSIHSGHVSFSLSIDG